MHGGKANAENGGGRRGRFWRIAPWVIATLILLLPLGAMQFTNEVVWDETDFAVIGAMLFGACGAYELAARMTGNIAYRGAVGVALAATFVLIWLNAAVGIIGTEDNPANLMYGGVLAVGIIGAIIARFQPDGLARALFATALAQAFVAVIVLIAGMQHASYSSLAEIVGLNGFFVALFLGSAWLFRRAAREQTPAGAAP